jgi:hypothetical protein
MATMTARLEDWLKDDIEAFWRQRGEKPSPGLRRVIQEWWCAQHFPAIGFRDGVGGRRAVVRGGPDVWEVILVARDYGADREGLYAHFPAALDRTSLDQALAYAERFPDEITALLDANSRLERVLMEAAPR